MNKLKWPVQNVSIGSVKQVSNGRTNHAVHTRVHDEIRIMTDKVLTLGDGE